ncbi:MAG: glycosyltransferase family 2 protein [Armatimonadetes bacterium]|nr:glycosyltransferase family 2 protein [Armatimonadota bacterium]MDW8122405.1 glycosyltransferase family 2 protein [Armatimonadota bacterium]
MTHLVPQTESGLGDDKGKGVLPEKGEATEVSIVIPCLNEERSVGFCVREALEALSQMNVKGEVVVADNGSTDRSAEIAEKAGARVVRVTEKGYGNALMGGIEAAKGSLIVIGDGDGSYDFHDAVRLIGELRKGNDLVIGSRFLGRIEKGAMPWTSRLGNPIMTGIVNLLFGTHVTDSQSGMRSFTRDAYRKMRLQSAGMEWASEMIIKARKAGLKVSEVPITLRRDLRGRPSHLRPFRDGWRHLKLMLTYSPTVLFLLPGSLLFLIGILLMTSQLLAPMEAPFWLFGRVRMDFHWAILGSLLTLAGYQIVVSHFLAKVYSVSHRFQEEDKLLKVLFQHLRTEQVLLASVLTFLLGLTLDGWVLVDWLRRGYGALVSGHTRLVIFGSTLMALGIQSFFNAFLFSIISDAYRRSQSS